MPPLMNEEAPFQLMRNEASRGLELDDFEAATVPEKDFLRRYEYNLIGGIVDAPY